MECIQGSLSFCSAMIRLFKVLAVFVCISVNSPLPAFAAVADPAASNRDIFQDGKQQDEVLLSCVSLVPVKL